LFESFINLVSSTGTVTNLGFSGKEKQITIKIHVSLKETFEEETGESIQDVLSQSSYSGKMKWSGDKLRINSDLFATLFDMVAKNIVEHLNNLLREPEVKGTTNILSLLNMYTENVFTSNLISYKFFIVVPMSSLHKICHNC
jgi:hypothetical protein